LANSAQAKKRVRQAEKHRQQNTSQRSTLRTSIKGVINAVAAGNQEQAQVAYKTAVPIIDRMVNKGLIHKNKAARHKSRLNAQLRGMSSAKK